MEKDIPTTPIITIFISVLVLFSFIIFGIIFVIINFFEVLYE